MSHSISGGCLIYVCITRPDIQFAVSQVSKFMHSPGSQHWKAVKRIFRYLSGSIHLGLFYPKGGSLPPDLHAFSGLVAMTQECPLVVFVSCSVAHAYLG